MNRAGTASAGFPTLTDMDLLDLLRAGDRRAGNELVRRHHYFITNIVRELVKDDSAVEDVVQESFIKALSRSHLYDPSQGKFVVWLLTVSRNEAITHLRRAKRFKYASISETDPEGGIAPTERPSQRLSKREIWDRVVEQINTLADPDRAILTARMVESKPFPQIAKALGLPLDTVKTIYYRCVGHIKQMLESAGG